MRSRVDVSDLSHEWSVFENQYHDTTFYRRDRRARRRYFLMSEVYSLIKIAISLALARAVQPASAFAQSKSPGVSSTQQKAVPPA